MILVSKWFVRLVTFKFARAITLFPFIILREKSLLQDRVLINHEKIHLRQQMETLVLLFYVWYLLEYLVKLLIYRNHYKAYKNISFEKEAFVNEQNENYLIVRKLWSFVSYL